MLDSPETGREWPGGRPDRVVRRWLCPPRSPGAALPTVAPTLHGWWPLPRGGAGAGAWEPLECRPLVVAESAVSPPLLSRCSFYVRRPGVYRPYPWAHVVAEFVVVAVLRCEAVLAA